MFLKNIKTFLFGFIVLIACQLSVVKPALLGSGLTDTLSNLGWGVQDTVDGVVSNLTSLLQDPVTKALCHLRTDELITYYGYEAEEHTVTTEDGYILTIFRCNSKKATNGTKKVVMIQHGIIASSDDWALYDPTHALPYILADAGYDVWLFNARGNFYSTNHTTLNPKTDSAFWNFSWYEIALYDLPAAYKYILNATNNEKLFHIGHSQGTTSPMVLLSEKPEYNDYLHAIAMLAPVGYFNNSGLGYQVWAQLLALSDQAGNFQIFPRGSVNYGLGTVCGLLPLGECDAFLNVLFGPSEDQANKTMLGASFCHSPAGAGSKQLYHYAQEVRYGFFGPYMTNSTIPNDFDVSQITVPVSMHYSAGDILADPADVQRLIPKIKSVKYVQVLNETQYNHVDFQWGISNKDNLYPKVMAFFDTIDTSSSTSN